MSLIDFSIMTSPKISLEHYFLYMSDTHFKWLVTATAYGRLT
jgi:hypothetical protein